MTVERREVRDFDRVRFRGPGVLKILQDGTESVTIHAPDYMLEDIESEVREGELRLGYQRRQVVSLSAHREVVSFTLHVKELNGLDCAGVAVKALVPDLDTDRLILRLSGAGHIILEHLTADELESRISGAGVVQVKGDVERQQLRISGAGDYRAGTLVSDFAAISISGAGKADVSVSDQLDVSISGAGQVIYEGYPEISRQISGMGKLTRRRGRESARVNGGDHGG